MKLCGAHGDCCSDGQNERDKGWAWVIAGAAFVASGATFGIWKTLSLFFNDWSKEFEADPGEVSYVQAISFAVLTCASPIAGASVRRWGSRPTVMLGGILAASGAGLSFFAGSLTDLYIYIGGICHFGICLTYLPSFISLGTWMDKKRSLANSLGEMGGPLMAFILPLVFQKLRDTVGWRFTMLVAAGLYLMIVFSGLLQKPFKQTSDEGDEESKQYDAINFAVGEKNQVHILVRDSNSKEVNGEEEKRLLTPNGDTKELTIVTKIAPPSLCNRIEAKLKEGTRDFLTRVPPHVWGKILFYMIYCLFQFGGLFALNLFIVPYATNCTIGRCFTEQQSSYLLSINAALDLIGRPLSGVILSLRIVSNHRIEMVSFFMALYGVVCFLFRFATSYFFFATLYGAAGLLFGFWNGTYWTVIPDVFGEELFPLAASCGMMMGGVALLLAAPIAATLIETEAGYNGVAYQSAVQLLIASFLLFFLKTNWPCCKVQPEAPEPYPPAPASSNDTHVGARLAVALPALSTPSTGGAMKRKTFSVVDLAMSMTPRGSMHSLTRSNKSTMSLNKTARSTTSLHKPQSAVYLDYALKPPSTNRLTHASKSACSLQMKFIDQ